MKILIATFGVLAGAMLLAGCSELMPTQAAPTVPAAAMTQSPAATTHGSVPQKIMIPEE